VTSRLRGFVNLGTALLSSRLMASSLTADVTVVTLLTAAAALLWFPPACDCFVRLIECNALLLTNGLSIATDGKKMGATLPN